MLILDGDPTVDPTVVLRPFAMTFGDRVMRLAEMQVLRDASERGEAMHRDILALEVAGVDEDTIRRWYTSTQAGSTRVSPPAARSATSDSPAGPDSLDSTASRAAAGRARDRRGEPRHGLHGSAASFEIATAPSPDGLTVELAASEQGGHRGRPGSSAAPDHRSRPRSRPSPRITWPERPSSSNRELIYGNGPIGLARALSLHADRGDRLPPCFGPWSRSGCWRSSTSAWSAAHGGDCVRRVSRWPADALRLAVDPVWVEEFPQVGIPAID